jgi:prophage antirepressor-like protein
MEAQKPISKKDFNGIEVSVYGTTEDPKFLAKDVAEILGVQNPTDMIRSLDESERGVVIIYTLGGPQSVSYLTEDGLYEVLMLSRKPVAKTFKKVVKQMLREMRQHGFTATESTLEKMLTNPDLIIGLAQNLKKERELRQMAETTIQIQAPKVEYHDRVLSSASDHTTTTIAKELGMSARSLNRKLKDLHIQFVIDGHWVLSHKYQNLGYTATRTHPYYDEHGILKTAILTVWTEKGRQFIHQKLNPVLNLKPTEPIRLKDFIQA